MSDPGDGRATPAPLRLVGDPQAAACADGICAPAWAGDDAGTPAPGPSQDATGD